MGERALRLEFRFMPIRRVAVLSVHTSPLAQPGAGDSGGMNVYVRSLASALARAGIACDVFTRADHPDRHPVVSVEPGFRVVHVRAGPCAPVPKRDLAELVEPLVDAVIDFSLGEGTAYDALHANYWLSGAVAHRLKHELDRPMVATFHTLARVKADAGVGDDPDRRTVVEREVVGCADLMLASTEGERCELAHLYDGDPDRIEVVPPGVDHSVFHPEGREAARSLLGMAGHRVMLFAGRIQPLKGAGLAIRCLAELEDRGTALLVVGGPSGEEGADELARLHALAGELGLREQVQFLPAQPHRSLANLYRAADVCLVPSRSESFGLVALEAAACGTPVVAAAVGGLRSLVDDAETGFLVESRDPQDYASCVATLLADRDLAERFGGEAAVRSRRYSWSIAAARLRRLYGDLVERDVVRCE